MNEPAKAVRLPPVRGLWLAILFLLVVLVALFHRSFEHGLVLFNNDGPYGAAASQAAQLPSGFHGFWGDLTWLGGESVSSSPDVTTLTALLLRPLGFSKFYIPVSLFVLGLSATVFLRRLGLAPAAWIIGGIAATLNSDFFSTGCWGVAAQPVSFGFNYLALALMTHNSSSRHRWLHTVLAGFCVGVGVMEGFDIGAIFSLFTAAYVVYQSWNVEDGGTPVARLRLGVVRVAVIAVFAGFIATHTLSTLVGTQVKGIAGTGQDEQTKKQQWGFATQWSTPKIETLQIIIPGVFGYRMDTPGGANYWGAIGQHPVVPELVSARDHGDEQAKRMLDSNSGLWRFTGSGLYAGVPVVMIALWAAFSAFRKQGSPFSPVQRRSIGFWVAVAVIGLLLGWGKYAPFYQFFYALPYASTIRNPFKFMHIFNWALIVLFAYGVHGLWRTWLQRPAGEPTGLFNWSKLAVFDRRWLQGCVAALVAGVLGLMIYGNARDKLEAHLQTVGFDASLARIMAAFSVHAVGWFVAAMVMSVVLLLMIFGGRLAGPRAKLGATLLGALVLFDLARADLPWIDYWDADYKYATNPIIDLLRTKPYEHRVTMLPYGTQSQQWGLFGQVYSIEWVQQLFEFYNIQSLDVIQEPRVAVDKAAFVGALPYDPSKPFNILRTWELTNTRYLLGPAKLGPESTQPDEFVQALNDHFDPAARRFKLVQAFDLAPKPGSLGASLTDYAAIPDPKGELAVIEFTGALPRASLFANWQANTNDDAVLKTLASPAFDPHQTVLVSDPIAPPPPGATNQVAGTVQIKPNYEPKRIEMDADVKTPAILLLCDRYSPNWHVTVDGQPASLLRCNFIVRGVQLQPGHHDVVFQYSTSQASLHISFAALFIGLALCGFLAIDWARVPATVPVASSGPTSPAKD